jgi:hypothetical protein
VPVIVGTGAVSGAAATAVVAVEVLAVLGYPALLPVTFKVMVLP